MRRFKIDAKECKKSHPVIRGTEANHMINVLRLREGDLVALLDGNGIEYEAGIKKISSREVRLSIKKSRRCPAESPIRITVAQGFLKDKKMDTLIRQLTELGISRWIPFFAARSVPRPDAQRLSNRMTRWQKIAAESLKQCQRALAPRIQTAAGFEQMIRFAGESDVKIAFWEAEETAVLDVDSFGPQVPEDVFIIIGPEGGITAGEISQAQQAGFKTVGMGPRILRAETATIAACALVQYLFGDMGRGVLNSGSRIKSTGARDHGRR
jgi:16S rRNA (uracil1498-N3)-methyltransferase